MTFGLLLNPNFVSHFFRQTVFTISRKWSEGFDPFKESSNFEILLFSLSGLLCASATYNVEFIPCLVELLSLTFDFLLGGDFISKSFILCFSRRPLLCGTDQTHGFQVQVLCCGIMVTLSNNPFSNYLWSLWNCIRMWAGHWQVANLISPVDFWMRIKTHLSFLVHEMIPFSGSPQGTKHNMDF